MPEPIDFAGDHKGIEAAAAGEAAEGQLIASVAAHSSFAAAEGVWRDFERRAVMTAYHRFDWLEAWHRHIGAPKGIEPLIVVARQASGAPALIWPLGVKTVGAARVASWLGGKLVNYQFGLYDGGTAARIDRSQLMPVMAHLREHVGIDALSLRNQPHEWRGIANPLLDLPHQPSPSFAYSVALDADFEAVYASLRSGSTRKKLRRSERRLAEEFGGCSLRRPKTYDELDRVLDTFFLQKSERMRERHITNVFAEPGVMGLFHELGQRSIGSQTPLLDLFWLDAGGRVAATWAGTSDGSRMSGIINSFDLGVFAPFQPGEILLRNLIEHLCRSGVREFDLGIGEAQYKRSWCPRTDPLFDSFLPLSAMGWMHTTAAMTGFKLKRAAKQSQFLRALAEKLR